MSSANGLPTATSVFRIISRRNSEFQASSMSGKIAEGSLKSPGPTMRTKE
jgi:hypothetical protein